MYVEQRELCTQQHLLHDAITNCKHNNRDRETRVNTVYFRKASNEMDTLKTRTISELPFIEIPRDENDCDFVVSFDIEDKISAKHFFDEYGFVVRNFLSYPMSFTRHLVGVS